VYWPWGAGGNLVKNICTVDTEFDWFDQQPYRPSVPLSQHERYQFMLDYYRIAITPETWLEREWSIRSKYTAKYYEQGRIAYWDPDWATVYECHGQVEEIDSIIASKPLLLYDRTQINSGQLVEQPSTWTPQDCKHVFLLPANLHLITDIYQSKNPTLNQINPNGTDKSRRQQAFIVNRLMALRLQELADSLIAQGQQVYKYTADTLFCNIGNQVIKSIASDLQLNIPLDLVGSIHDAWLTATQQVYRQYWNKELF
jgi:hypothetical protein